MGSGRSGEVPVLREQGWKTRKAMSGPLWRNSVSSGERGEENGRLVREFVGTWLGPGVPTGGCQWQVQCAWKLAFVT